MIVMSALATLGSLTVVSVQGSLKASTNDRAQAIAQYAAESGVAVAMDFLRKHYNDPLSGNNWSCFVHQSNLPAPTPLDQSVLPGNGVLPSDTTGLKLFSADQNASFQVVFLNNRDDDKFNDVTVAPPCNNDADSRIMIQSTGRGPQGALAIVEVEVARAPFTKDGLPNSAEHLPPIDPPPTSGFIIMGWRIAL